MHFVCTAPVLKVFVCHSQSVLERHLTDAAKKGKFRQQKPRYTAVNPDITDIYDDHNQKLEHIHIYMISDKTHDIDFFAFNFEILETMHFHKLLGQSQD